MMNDINPYKKHLDIRHLIHEDYKFAAMDWDKSWWVYTHKPNCIDDMWDAKEGRSEKVVARAVEVLDWRDSLSELDFSLEDE